MKRQFLAVPAKGSPPVAVLSTQPSRYVTIQEDDAATEQGLIFFFKQDNYTQGYTVAPDNQPYELGNPVSRGMGYGPILGHPVQIDAGGTVTLRPADTYVQVTSATATATHIRVEEHS